MKVTAIIAEYNPLHNGHIKHIETAKYETGADCIIAVMSGDYVQRGAPAIISKYERAYSALLAGADLVIELPVCYSTGSLEYYSRGAVSLTAKTGIADCISFGSECGDIGRLKEASSVIRSLSSSPSSALRDRLKQGLNYSDALNSLSDIPEQIREVLREPNNLLAASYIAASDHLSFDCEFHTMKRAGSGYHDASEGALSSTAIRRALLSAPLSSLKTKLPIPEAIAASMFEYLEDHTAMSEDIMSLLLFAKIHDIIKNALCGDFDPAAKLTSYLDVSESLANKLINNYLHEHDYASLCSRLKSKDVNYSRISRALLHILLGIRNDHLGEYINDGYHYYIKILGMRRASSELLHTLKKKSVLPLISKNADAEQILKNCYMSNNEDTYISNPFKKQSMYEHARRMFIENTAASDLYNKTACVVSRQSFLSEYEHSPVILP